MRLDQILPCEVCAVFQISRFLNLFLNARVFIKPYIQVTVFKEEQDWDPTSKMKLTTSAFDTLVFLNLRFYVCLSLFELQQKFLIRMFFIQNGSVPNVIRV